MDLMHTIIREPLVHFLFISALFFLGFEMVNSQSEDQQSIVITDGRIAELENSFTSRWKREPLQEELNNAIDGYALNQMYLNEARAMQLDIGDQIVEKRLRQKMNYLLDSMAISQAPSEQQLLSFYQETAQRYQVPAQYSLIQVFISQDSEDIVYQQKISQQQTRIEQGLAPQGDASLLPAEFERKTAEQLASHFGFEFTEHLKTIELDHWVGPIPSALGQHFVKVHDKTENAVKPFNQVKERVLQEWRYQQKKSYQKVYEEQLIAKYSVTRATDMEDAKDVQ
jgi:hypothetical protein